MQQAEFEMFRLATEGAHEFESYVRTLSKDAFVGFVADKRVLMYAIQRSNEHEEKRKIDLTRAIDQANEQAGGRATKRTIRQATAQANKRVSSPLFDPWESLAIYNHIVQALRNTQPKVDAYLNEAATSGTMQNSSRIFVQCWLDVSIKLLNSANRVQVTSLTCRPSTELASIGSVCNIIFYGDGTFSRLFLRDKTGRVDSLPTIVPLSKSLSEYVAIFLYATRNESAQMYLFSDGAGGVWEGASSKIMEFVQEISNLPQPLFPRQHFLRNLFLNATLMKAKYTRSALESVGKLTRNSLNILAYHYVRWNSYYHQRTFPFTSPSTIFDTLSTTTPATIPLLELAIQFCNGRYLPASFMSTGGRKDYWEISYIPLDPLRKIGECHTFRRAGLDKRPYMDYLLVKAHSVPAILPNVFNYSNPFKQQSYTRVSTIVETARELTYKAFVGVETSRDGVVVTEYTVATQTYIVHYFSDGFEVKSQDKITYIKYEFVWGTQRENEAGLHQTLSTIFENISKKFPPASVRCAVIPPMATSTEVDKLQNNFTEQIQRTMSLWLPEVSTETTEIIKTYWMKGSESSSLNGLYRTDADRKITEKFKMYLVWINKRLPHLFQAPAKMAYARQDKDTIMTLSDAEEIRSFVEAFKTCIHPVSDIVESFALITYLKDLDARGPLSQAEKHVDYNTFETDQVFYQGFKIRMVQIGVREWKLHQDSKTVTILKVKSASGRFLSTGVTLPIDPTHTDIHDPDEKLFCFAQRPNEKNAELRMNQEFNIYHNTPPTKDMFFKRYMVKLSMDTRTKFVDTLKELTVYDPSNPETKIYVQLKSIGDDHHLMNSEKIGFYLVLRPGESAVDQSLRSAREKNNFDKLRKAEQEMFALVRARVLEKNILNLI